MKIITKPEKMQETVRLLKKQGFSIGFVPTMGALHYGHASLIKKARQENKKVVVSIFVNPAQFGYNEDFLRYPRNLKKDSLFCRRLGVDFIFYPKASDIYPEGFKTYVNVEGMGDVLCGFYRPGHFKGVVTIVAKLFNIIPADIAYFGQKDAQQLAIIQRMVQDLNLPIKIRSVATVRDNDGLALSSRNVYLNKKTRKDALALSGSLKLASGLVKKGVYDCSKICEAVKEFLVTVDPQSIDYVAIVDPQTLKPLRRIKKKALLVLAVRIGQVRLIDNAVLEP
jgi:pantoate--beta-alanine ligase